MIDRVSADNNLKLTRRNYLFAIQVFSIPEICNYIHYFIIFLKPTLFTLPSRVADEALSSTR
jgi:hypothetical protein